ncbi:MAG: relaxase/mobilization nuclease domain-containing protein [Deltaproteobacteria bacterium]|nr:relaxase/mobilization nuclease domain-containing protein [Deltaproteobacteria bacterium]
MIPTITKKGTSFKGAAAYYLHDKNAQTNERIDFTQTQNLATDDPEMAWKMMAYTAMHQSEIKQAAGGVSKGRKLTQPVYAYSLAWHPAQEPTKEHMIESGLKTLKVLGLCEHEAILVAHNDADHKHVHLIVNRVHPETGVAAKVSNDRLKMSKWAEGYERGHGKILCEERVKNNERRRNGEYIKFKEDLKKAEYYRWQREKTRQACEQREKDSKTLDGLHKKNRDELLNNKEKLIKEQIARIKELNRPSWASIYRQQKEESHTIQEAQLGAMSRFFDYLKNRNQEREHGALDARRGLLSGAYNAVTNSDELANALSKKQEQDRRAFAEKIAQQSRLALEHINDNYSRYLEGIKANQLIEQQLMKERHTQESQRRAADIVSGKVKEEFDRHHKMKESFRKTQEPQNDNKPPPDLKEDFNRDKEDQAYRYLNDNRQPEKDDSQANDSDMKKDLNKSRFIPDHQEQEKGQGRFTNRDTGREPG